MPDVNRLYDWFSEAAELSGEEQAAFLESRRESEPTMVDQLQKLLSPPPVIAEKLERFFCAQDSDRDATHASEEGGETETGFEVSAHAVIGPYKLLEPIGEGGMGVVYLAQQSQPVRRKVALKVIKPGMDSRQVVARFEAERQALAMMEHPNIAQVLDAGTTDEARPYFVMELVRGIPITEYCDRAKMPIRQRLELVCDACSAIQHAHNKGIIHRDIKPSNVLVTENDGTPLVKVIDFGVAKALTGNLTDKTMYTGVFQMIGTPLYMSPEQASFSNFDVDTRSDVYSLGVLLYELITGMLPIDRVSIKEMNYEQLRDHIQNSEPIRPSRRLSTLKDELETIAERRGLDIRRIRRHAARELDWIVMKAIEKDRTRRYQSARELGEDVRRYLRDEAVEACPPSAGYRLGKFARRHRVALTASTLVLAALIAGFSTAAWQAVVAIQERDRTAEQRDRAVAAETIASAVNDFLNEDLLAQANLDNQPNPNVKLRTVIGQAAEKLETRFEDQPLVEAAIRHTLATGFISLGKYATAAEHLSRAVKLRTEGLGLHHRDTIDSEQAQIFTLDRLGKHREAYQRFQAFLPRAQSSLEMGDKLQLEIARVGMSVFSKWGDYKSAESLAQQAMKKAREQLEASDDRLLRLLTSITSHYRRADRKADAYRISSEVRQQAKKSKGTLHPLTLTAEHNHAVLILELDKPIEAEKLFRSVLDRRLSVLGEDHPETIRTSLAITISLLKQGKSTLAIEMASEALDASDRLLGGNHGLTLAAMSVVADCHRHLNDPVQAASLQKVILQRHRQTLGPEHPDTIGAMFDLAASHYWQGLIDQAIEMTREAIRLAEKTLGPDHEKTCIALNNLTVFLSAVGQIDEVIEIHKRVLADRRKRLGPDHPKTLISIDHLARAYRQNEDYPAAKDLLLEGKRLSRERYGPQHIEHAQFLWGLVNLFIETHRKNDPEANGLAAIDMAQQSLVIHEAQFGAENMQTIKANALLATTLAEAGQFKEAKKEFVNAIDRCTSAYDASHPETLNIRRVYAVRLIKHGDVDEAIYQLQDMLERSESNPSVNSAELIHIVDELAGAYFNRQRHAECLTMLQTWLPRFEKHFEKGNVHVRYTRNTLAKTHRELARANDWQGEHMDAWKRVVRESLAIIEALGADAKNTAKCKQDLCNVLWHRVEQLVLDRQFEHAVKKLSEIAALLPDHRRVGAEAERLLTLDEKDRNDLIARYFTTADIDTFQTLIDRGDWHRTNGDHEKAIEDFTAAIRLQPDSQDGKLWRSRGLAHYELEQNEEALSDLSKAIELDPNDNWSRKTRGWVHKRLGQLDAALADLTKCIDLRPSDRYFYTVRARIYRDLRDFEAALADCKKAIDIDPESDAPYFRRAVAYALRGLIYADDLQQYHKAAEEYAKALELDPENSDIAENRGHALQAIEQ